MGRSWVICFVLLLVPVVVAADDKAPDAADAAYQEGRRLYDLRDWDRAIEKFKQSYELRPDGPSLFNIAQAYRLKGDCVNALGYYKTYARNFPGAANIEVVNKFITELEPCAKQQEKSAHMPPEGTAETKVTTETKVMPPAEPPADGSSRRRLGLIVAGGGAVLGGTSLVLGLLARSKWNEALEHCDASFSCDDPGLALGDSARTRATAATVVGVVGLAGIAAGAVIYLTAPSGAERGVAITPVISPRASGVAVGGRF